MSIQAASEHSPKRRKLSHSSDGINNSKNANGARSSVTAVESGDGIQRRSSESRAPLPVTTNGTAKKGLAVGGLTRSSLLTSQARDLIEHSTPDYQSHIRRAQPELNKLVAIIKASPPIDALSLTDAEKLLKKQGISIPFAGFPPSRDINYKFSFQTPASVHVRGAPVLQIGATGNNDLEIAVEIPTSYLQPKDYLDYRAFHKRAFIVACIAASLKKSVDQEYELDYDTNDGNPILPMIRLIRKPQPQYHQSPTFFITVLFPSDPALISKMLPTKSCIRSKTESAQTEVTDPKPTPFYNSTFLVTGSVLQYDETIRQSAHRCAAFKDSCILGNVWLQQRGFGTSIEEGGFGWYDWALLTAMLLSGGGHRNRPLFSDSYTSIQLFKAVLQVIANRDLMKEPLIVGTLGLDLPGSNFPIMLDASTGTNILYKLTRWSYLRLRHLAQSSLTTINSRQHNNFVPLFIDKISDILLEFDEVYIIKDAHLDSKSGMESQQQLFRLHEILEQGLGDRADLIHLSGKTTMPWKSNKSSPKHEPLSSICVSLLVNSSASTRRLDRGPLAEERSEAVQFRELWGEKSELRRFKDGSITETLVWSEDRPVTHQIIQYLASFHFNVDAANVVIASRDLLSLRHGNQEESAARNSFTMINAKFQDLSSKLYQLEGLPLPIRAVSPSHANLRSAASRLPLTSRLVWPTDVTVQFDSSTRWPDHLPAIQYTKIAFLAKLSDLLTQADSSYTTRLGIENTDSSPKGIFNTSFLDIILPSPGPGLSPIVFRLRIHHDREVHLLQSQLSDKDFSRNSRESLSTALAQHKQSFLASPIHTSTLRNLITHFAPLSGTIRLLKSWIASHHVSNHISEVALEIIAASVFLRPTTWSVPGTASAAFIRCLHFLAHWDWTSTPLLVDMSINQDMSPAAYTELETRFQAWRKLDPAMNNVAWFIGTSIDETGTVWTQGTRPARVVASRITALANAAVEFIKTKGLAMQADDWSDLFVSGVDDFDFIIYLKPSIVKSLSNQGKKNKNNKSASQYKNLVMQQEMDVDDIGHDVVGIFLADIERALSSSVLFFHGEGEAIIAGLWKPNTLGLKEWRVSLGVSTVPVASNKKTAADGNGDEMCEINKEGILNEIGRLGEGMIEKIVLKG